MNTDVPHTHAEPLQDRLGLRLAEFGRATGMSLPTICRRVKNGDIKITYIGGMPLITRHELVRLGLVEA